jgi:alkaline phosphatase D
MPTIAMRNGHEISLASFTVMNGVNKLLTNGLVTGGVAESESLKYGTIPGTNATNDTATRNYFVSSYTVDTS